MRRNVASRHSLQGSGGPLLTEHLKNLDLELQLLKRKREMIEQQQNLYDLPRRQYDQSSSYNQQQFSSNRDYSSMYGDAPTYRSQQGVKRRAEPQWESPKTYQAKKKNVQSLFANRLGPKVNSNFSGPSRFQPPSSASQNPRPSFKSSTSIRPLITQKKPFKAPTNSGRVTKPKPVSAPNKIASRPIAERGHLVAMATQSSAAADEALVLREDRVPTKQVTGRLELALGSILKDMTENYGHVLPYSKLLASAEKKRVIKQTIREQIRDVMMGKVVGSSVAIIDQYRAMYPQETDLHLLDKVLKAGDGPLVIETRPKTIIIKDHDKEFKSAMYKLMESRLEEIFNKVKEIFGKDDDADKPPNVDFTDDNLEMSTSKQDEPTRAEILAYKNGTVKRLLPKMLRKYIPLLIKLVNIDEMYDVTKNTLIEMVSQKVQNASSSAAQIATPTKNTSVQNEGGTKQPKVGITWPYYVKIMARPTLPKKNVMREFLEKFNTKTIKKHKGVHNLLFIGFSEKSDYDNILAANGTKIGRIALDISPSERASNKENKQASLDDSDDKLITPELDGQITDLLISIRKADEEDKSKEDITEEQNSTVNPDKKDSNENDVDCCVVEDNAVKEVEIDLTENDTDETIKETQEESQVTGEQSTVKSDETQEKTNNETVQNTDKSTEPDQQQTVLDTSEKSTVSVSSDNVVEVNDTVTKPSESAAKTTEAASEASKEDVEIVEPSETLVNATSDNDTESLKKDADLSKPTESDDVPKEDKEKQDTVTELKNEGKETGRSTPTRMTRSANATPSTIRTRRASRLAQNP